MHTALVITAEVLQVVGSINIVKLDKVPNVRIGMSVNLMWMNNKTFTQ